MGRVSINVDKLAYSLILAGHYYVTVTKLARMLGISTKTAGKLLAEMERKGLARRWSRRTYKLELKAWSPVNSQHGKTS